MAVSHVFVSLTAIILSCNVWLVWGSPKLIILTLLGAGFAFISGTLIQAGE